MDKKEHGAERLDRNIEERLKRQAQQQRAAIEEIAGIGSGSDEGAEEEKEEE